MLILQEIQQALSLDLVGKASLLLTTLTSLMLMQAPLSYLLLTRLA